METAKTHVNNQNWSDWSEDEWASWIENKLSKRQKSYDLVPEDLIGSYNREKSHAKDYHGREILELIQNADDAGLNYSGKSKLAIKLTETALMFANTGIPFSDEGIESLMVSDVSPKQMKGLKFIGYKGLGFRSVLGWASSIAILSGNAKIGFSQKMAQKWLEKIKAESHDVSNRLEKHFQKTGIKAPIAILDTPFILDDKKIDDEGLKKLIQEGVNFLGQEFDTVVCLSFSSPEKTLPQVKEQINSIRSETLLFLQHITKMSIDCLGVTRRWDVEREEDLIKVTPYGGEPQIWNLFSDENEIPEEFLSSDQKELSNRYEIKIAVPAQSNKSPERLFVYFSTKEKFPFPIVAHATFELSANRQYLNDSDANRYIAKKLSKLMATSAGKIAKANQNDPWLALKSFLPKAEISLTLESFGFLRDLVDNLKNEEIVPTINGGFETANKVKRLRGNFDDLLQGDCFNDICLFTKDEYLYKHIEIQYLDYDELVERINKISGDLLLKERANLIYEFCMSYSNSNTSVKPNLLVDDNNQVIPGDITAILPPEGRKFSLPNWVPSRIINSELISLLRDIFKIGRVRDLRYKLSIFKVHEYNLTSVVSTIVTETNRRIKSSPDDEKTIRIDMVQALWEIYSSIETASPFQERIPIRLPTRQGEDAPADELYFGKQYTKGQLLEYLYGNIDSSLFVAAPKELGFNETSEEIESFLSWLGVADSPKYLKKNISNQDYKEYVISQLKTPVQFGELVENDPIKLSRKTITRIDNVFAVDRLEEVIEIADPHEIVCWIAGEQNIDNWRIKGDQDAKLWYNRGGRYDSRPIKNQAIFSYPLWLLMSAKWMPTIDGIKKAPHSCSISKKAKELSPIIGYPAFDIDHPLIKELGLDRTLILNALSKIGVVSDLDELPWDSFYDLLLNMPEIDPSGDKAKTLYRTLVSRANIDNPPPGGEKYHQFIEKGLMLGRKKGETGYYPIGQLFYVENNVIPEHITEHYPLVEIDRKKGVKKVYTLFGIEQLTNDKIQIQINQVKIHFLNDRFQDEINRLKPYIYALRVDEDNTQIELGRIKRLSIVLCESVAGTMVVEDIPSEISIEPGKSIQDSKDKNKVYLVSNVENTDSRILQNELIASAIGEIVTNIFRVDISSNIARLISCSSTNRDKLLDKIVGGAGNDRLAKACELLESDIDEGDIETIFKPPPKTSTPPEGTGQGEKTIDKVDTGAQDDSDDYSTDDVGVVGAKETEHVPTESKGISVRVRVNPRPGKPSKIANPNRAENLSMRFEESQNRFPLKVSHLQGFETFGCDIISFSSSENLTLFQNNNDLGLVERFIEVKGSTNQSGSVNLVGNEQNRARESKSKYYLYRVFEDSPGIFELVELCDPLDEESAGKWQYIVNPFQSKRTKRYDVVETVA
ncbi:DUF3883 domain-containing protein [Patescibacteria group bacterium]|nr:DUF3883 domain-containing protein [Patescibacteria group bacterium]